MDTEKPGGKRNMKFALESYFKSIELFDKAQFNKLKCANQKSCKKHILNKEEWERLKKVLPDKFELLFKCLKNAGIRIGELIDLRVKDITFEGDTKG